MSSPDLSRAVTEIASALGKVKVISWCTPLEATDAAAWLVTGAPQSFHLTYPSIDLASVMTQLQAGRRAAGTLGNHPLTAAIDATIVEGIDAARAISTRDDDVFSEWSRRRYGLPSQTVLAEARRLAALARPYSDLGPRQSAERFAADAAEVLHRYSLHSWRPVLKQRLAKVAVDSTRQEIVVRADATFSPAETQRLLVHEIGGHVLRAANAEAQPDHTARLALGNATPTEEGLATWLEEDLGASDGSRLRLFAARALAVHHAQDTGASGLVEMLEPIVGSESAVAVALRVKRGLRDPEAPGGFTKDHSYLTGLLELRSVLNDRAQLTSLMATRWPLDYLSFVRQMLDTGLLVPPNLLPAADPLTPKLPKPHTS